LGSEGTSKYENAGTVATVRFGEEPRY